MPELRAFIKEIAVSNFKSFENIDVSLNMFNSVIGANASGKSNFVSLFRFLRDISLSGLDNAISLQGGITYITNVHESMKPLIVKIHVCLEGSSRRYGLIRHRDKVFTINEIVYTFELNFTSQKSEYSYIVKEEELEASGVLQEFKKPPSKDEGSNWKKISDLQLKIGLYEDKFEFSANPSNLDITMDEFFPLIHVRQDQSSLSIGKERKELNLVTGNKPFGFSRYYSPMSDVLGTFFSSISIFDIDPKVCKRSALLSGKTTLEADGSNLAIVLRHILTDEKKRKSFSNIIKDLLPFIESVSVERLADTSIITCVKEKDYADRVFPAPFISDGTINLAALVIALYFDEASLVIIEEPEKNVHPALISKIIGMMKDVSEKGNKQVIMTTHSTEAIRNTNIENILLIYKEKGFSILSRPVEKEEVKEFLRNDMGIDELYLQGLLQW